jgi:dihydrofolate reductase
MQKLIVFNHVSLDGYFTDAKNDMSFANNATPDAEWDAYVASNASGGGMFLFGRITYELMASFWPTAIAAKQMPVVAERMNQAPKVVFSRTLEKAAWENTRLLRDNLAAEVQKLKNEPGEGIVIFGSGSIVSQLTEAGLIDEYQLILDPIVLGKGRTMFEGMREPLHLKLKQTRVFSNGNVLLRYESKS